MNKQEFFVFLMCGGFAALVNFSSRIVLDTWFSFQASVFFAYIFGMIVAFFLNRYVVFPAGTQTFFKSVIYFTLVNCIGFFLTWLISVLVYYRVFVPLMFDFFAKEIAHLIGIVVPVFTSYIGHKHFSFRRH